MSREPTIAAAAVMALAAERDTIALQYANGFREVLREGLPAFAKHQQAGQPLETSIVGAYLHLLARYPDSLIVRKHGPSRAKEVSVRAAGVLEAGWPCEAAGRRLCDEFDLWLRQPSNRFNPGNNRRPGHGRVVRRA